jgi:uncharacterized protein YdiU (UPF0061 family)
LFKRLCAKIGLADTDPARKLGSEHLSWLETRAYDFTNGFSVLSRVLSKEVIPSELDADWIQRWRILVEGNQAEALRLMSRANPVYIARNHLVEAAILAVTESGDLGPATQLVEVLRQPFVRRPEWDAYCKPPQESERVCETFCGT